MKKISLSQDQVALVDDSDYKKLSQYKWCIRKHRSGNFYAIRKSSRKLGIRHDIYMHRQILELERGDGYSGDHQDHNTLNNQRNNLRICTNQQNCFNQKPQRNTISCFKGVTWYKRSKKWMARIQINGKRKFLGYFINEKDAARAYDIAAKKYFKEFACLNH